MDYYELNITIPDAFKKTLVDHLTRQGCLGVIEKEDSLIAYFPDAADMKSVVRELDVMKALIEKSGETEAVIITIAQIPGQDWNESWKKGFTPLDVGKCFTILPPWEKMREGRINLVIDPGMAFGTGHHETTRSCLVLMERYADTTRKERFLDLGTGTGLLAIAAVKLGYRNVTAVDTDPLSIEAVTRNRELNHVADIDLMRGSIADVHGTFDVIAANIISGVLVQSAPDISSSLSPGGIAILSGILAEQADEVITAYEHSGMTMRELLPDGKWVSIVTSRC
jgi:ribosomal protein L11 methyltransferase